MSLGEASSCRFYVYSDPSVLHTHCQLSLLGNWPCQLRVIKEGIRLFRFGFLAFPSPLLVLYFMCLPASDCCLSMACSEKTCALRETEVLLIFFALIIGRRFFPLKSVTVLMTTHKSKSIIAYLFAVPSDVSLSSARHVAEVSCVLGLVSTLTSHGYSSQFRCDGLCPSFRRSSFASHSRYTKRKFMQSWKQAEQHGK